MYSGSPHESLISSINNSCAFDCRGSYAPVNAAHANCCIGASTAQTVVNYERLRSAVVNNRKM